MFLAEHKNIKVFTGQYRWRMGFYFLLNIPPFHQFCDHPHSSVLIKETKELPASVLSPTSRIFIPFCPTLCSLLPLHLQRPWLLVTTYSAVFALKIAQELHVSIMMPQETEGCLTGSGMEPRRLGQHRPRYQGFYFPFRGIPAWFYLWIIRYTAC